MTANQNFLNLFIYSKNTILIEIYIQIHPNLPAMQETRVQSLGQEDPLEKEMATHSSLLTWEIPWTWERGGLHSMRLRKSWR